MLRLNYWNLAILVLTFLTATVHLIHISLLNHLNFIQYQNKKITPVTAHFSSPDDEVCFLCLDLNILVVCNLNIIT